MSDKNRTLSSASSSSSSKSSKKRDRKRSSSTSSKSSERNSLSSTTLESNSSHSDQFSLNTSSDEFDGKRTNKSLSTLSNRNSPSLSPSKHSSLTSSRVSLNSSLSNLSRANSFIDFQVNSKPIQDDLSLNVYRVLFSIKNSNSKIYNLKNKFRENVVKIKSLISNDEILELKNENEKLVDDMINESIGLISVCEVVYGESHWKLAWFHIDLARIYLEYKHLPEQSKHHCEKAWNIYLEDLKDEIRHDLTTSNLENFEYEFYNPFYNQHHTILNYTYGRACTLLKENEEGEEALEKALDYYENWKHDVKDKGKEKFKSKRELRLWKQKIYLALAKQYAINDSYGKAMACYDKFLDYLIKIPSILKKNNYLHASNKTDHEILVEVYQDKAKIEFKRGNHIKAVEMIKEAISKCEENGLIIYVQDLKASLANIYMDLDDINSSSKAEELYKEVIEEYEKFYDKNINEKTIQVKEDLAKYYVRQEKFEDAMNIFNSLIKEKQNYYGDFSLKLVSTYKLLCSIYLKKGDMPKAAIYLQKSLEVEEINYGAKSKKTLATKETLDNLKKNPNVQSVLKLSKTEKPKFNANKKIDYSKSDKNLYSNKNETESNSSVNNSKSISNQKEHDIDTVSLNSSISFTKKINPIK